MRRGEAIELDDEEFDARRGLLLVRHAKLGSTGCSRCTPPQWPPCRTTSAPRPAVPPPVSEALLVSSAAPGSALQGGFYLHHADPRAGLACLFRRCRPRPPIFGIHLRSPRSSTRAATAATSPAGCRCSGPPSATPTPPAPTGTCKLPRTTRRGRPPARHRNGRIPVTAIAATMQAFFTERLIAQRRRQPAHDHRLPDTCGCCWAGRPAHPDPAIRPRHRGPRHADDQRVPRPPRTSAGNSSARNPGWPRSTPCSASPRCAIPSTPPTSPGYSDPARTRRPDHRHLPHQHQTRPCSPSRTRRPDRAP